MIGALKRQTAPPWWLGAGAVATSGVIGYELVHRPKLALEAAVAPLLLLLAGTDVAFFLAVTIAIDVPKNTSHIWIAPPILGALAIARRGVHVPIRKPDVFFALLLLWDGISWKLHPETQVGLRFFAEYFALPMIGYVFARRVVTPTNLTRFLWVLMGIGAFGAATVLYEWDKGRVLFYNLSQYEWGGQTGIFRAGSLFTGAPSASVVLSMILLACLPLRRLKPRLFGFFVVEMVWAIVVTYSRAGWIGLAAGLLCAAVLLPYGRRARTVWMLGLAAVAFLAFQPTITHSRLFSLGVIRTNTVQDRQSLLSLSLPLVDDSTDHLLFGRGFDALQSTGAGDNNLIARPLLLFSGGPNDDYLRSILEQGLVGLVLTLAFTLSAIRGGVRRCRELVRGSVRRIQVASLTGAAVCYAASAFFHDQQHAIEVLMVMALLYGTLVAVTYPISD